MLLVSLVAVVTTVTGCTRTVEGSSVDTISAAVGLQQAEDLVTSIAARVSPGATVEDSTGKAGPDPCRAPQTGKVYYTIFKKFPAPGGANGATVQDQVSGALTAAGFSVRTAGETGGWPTLTASTTLVGVRVLLSPDTPEVRVVVDSRCGTP